MISARRSKEVNPIVAQKCDFHDFKSKTKEEKNEL